MRIPISAAELGQRLQAARKAKGLTQENVAVRLGIPRTSVVAIEKGDRSVRPEELLKLADLYGVPVSRLVAARQTIAAFVPQLRRPGALPEGLRAEVGEAIEAFRSLCEDYLTLEEKAGAEPITIKTAQYDIRDLAPEVAGEEVALRERARLGLGGDPVPHLRDVLELDVGLRVFSFAVPPSNLAGMFVPVPGLGGCILVNRKHPTSRQRWSLAHEYAHFLVKEDEQRGEVTILIPSTRQSPGERFAESFAMHFLMPTLGVRTRFREVVRAQGDFKAADLCRLARLYAVSVEAMCRRLEGLRLIPEGSWDRLKHTNFRVTEAQKSLGLTEDPGIGPRLPARYRALAIRLYQEGEISEGQLARYLRVDRLEARALVEESCRSEEVDEQGNVGMLSVSPDAPIGVRVG